MKKIYTLVSLAFLATLGKAQTLPQPFALTSGNYLLNSWDGASAPGTYPANMVFHYTNNPERSYYNHLTEGARDYDCAYNLTARSRIAGAQDSGFSFIATSSAQYNDCTSGTADTNRYVGDALLAVNTTGKTGVQVSWKGYIIAVGDGNGTPENAREATVRLQYRVGATGNYTDVVEGADTIECNTTGKLANTVIVLGTTLPAACDNQPLVYLRWVYYAIPTTGAAGTRPTIGVDDIAVGSGVLPVNLLSFSVANTSGAATLTWKTANEVNFSRFEVQRGTGNGSFSTIATVAAKGTGGNTYSLTDKQTGAGTNQYRLKLVNTDGSFTYSSTVTFIAGAKGNLTVTPNPVTDRFTLLHPQAGANALVSVYSFDGRKVASTPVALNAVQTPVVVSGLAKGNYLVVFTSGNQRMTTKLTKN